MYTKHRAKHSIRFDILTIFPHIFDSYFRASILKRAEERKLAAFHINSIRDFAADRHKTVDAKPYGGGAGMVMMALPILRAVSRVRKSYPRNAKVKTIILSAKGKQLTQAHAREWAKKYTHIILISGRYEGIDERVREVLRAEEISMGPYVVTDGDVAAMAVVSAVTRLIPGVIRLESLAEESHWNQVLKEEGGGARLQEVEYPHYTRPEVFEWPPKRGKKYRVPRVLLSGDHKKIKEWRRQM
ncbi:MAG: tRNA (guanosine(37)-N1)-methyltransferase TrmD [Candidatus Liptonbacteria bacterium]|nr:tRNA (guanosine(37)-N1)-methyltransferase TrmD [Candidatus Liptonbacteria bacterium]